MPYLLLQILLYVLLAFVIGLVAGLWLGRRYGVRRVEILERQVAELTADSDVRAAAGPENADREPKPASSE